MTSMQTRPPERGQMLVIFALVLIVMIAMTGLVIDGGDTFAQRRDMQNAADSAAMAGAYSYVNTSSSGSAIAAGQANAAVNGYTNDTNGVSVTITVTDSGPNGTTVKADVTGPHRNYFSGIFGMPTWTVSTTATALGGEANGAMGAMPLIFNTKAVPDLGFGPGTARAYDEPGTGSQDVPQTATSFNWTVYCTANGNPCNANSNTVNDLINGNGTSTVVKLIDAIGPLNAGAHTSLFSDLANKVGKSYPVGVVDNTGKLVGWASFFIEGSVGGSTKQIRGYFEGPTNKKELRIVQNGGSSSGGTGAYSVRLVN